MVPVRAVEEGEFEYTGIKKRNDVGIGAFLKGGKKAAVVPGASGVSGAKAGGRKAEREAEKAEKRALEANKYWVELAKPVNIDWEFGPDKKMYVKSVGGEAANKVEEGDMLLATSAVFGSLMWAADDFERTKSAIARRQGAVKMQLLKANGPPTRAEYEAMLAKLQLKADTTEDWEVRQKRQWEAKRNLGKSREELYDMGTAAFNAKRYTEAVGLLEQTLDVIDQTGDVDLKTESQTLFALACAYSQAEEHEYCVDTLSRLLKLGYDNFKRVRTYEGLQPTRDSYKADELKALVNKYDPPLINEDAVNAMKKLFGR